MAEAPGGGGFYQGEGDHRVRREGEDLGTFGAPRTAARMPKAVVIVTEYPYAAALSHAEACSPRL